MRRPGYVPAERILPTCDARSGMACGEFARKRPADGAPAHEFQELER